MASGNVLHVVKMFALGAGSCTVTTLNISLVISREFCYFELIEKLLGLDNEIWKWKLFRFWIGLICSL